MMTEYQRQKLDELVSWLWNFQDTHRHHDMEDAIKLVEEIRDYPMLTAQIEETRVDSAIMNAYFEKSLELFQSEDLGIPWVCPIDDRYAALGMPLDRFVELLGMRKKFKQFLSTCNREAFALWIE